MRLPTAPGRLSFLFRSGRGCMGSRRWLSLLAALALSIAAVAALPGQSGPPPGVRVSLAADSYELTVGDLVTISLIVSHPENYAVVVPRLEREWGPFEVQAQTSVQTVSLADGIRTVAKQFRVTLFAPGTFETPDLPVAVRGPDGTGARVSPAPLQLTVNSVLSSPDEELKDLRPPADLSTPLWERPVVLVLIAVAALVTAVGTAFLFIRRSRRAHEPVATLPDLRTPWEVATQELDRIARLDLPGRGGMKEHYTLVAAALRTYLGATFLRNADEMSAEEIAASIGQSALDTGNAKLVVELLQEADLVKFANHEPTAVRAGEALGQVRNFVDATRLTVAGASGTAPAVHGTAP